jgi:hypothetical protein
MKGDCGLRIADCGLKAKTALHRGTKTARPAFTLVELVTAASLMTVMMLGVIQIFSIITETASDARGLAFAHEQGRAVMDALHRDLRGMTREGYFTVQKKVIYGNSQAKPTGLEDGPKAPTTISEPMYYCDTLAFTSIGSWTGAWDTAQQAAAAEVVYTGNTRTPTYLLGVATTGSPKTNVDDRRGILARGVWLLGGQISGSASDTDDKADSASTSSPAYLCNLWSGTNRDRITAAGTGGGASGDTGYLKVWPVLSSTGSSTKPESLRRVMASCISEFFVEWLDTGPPGTGTGALPVWRATDTDVRPRTSPTGTTATNLCPRAVRVTVAIHDPGDRLPPPPVVDSTNPPWPRRFTGYALQEVFWLQDAEMQVK